VPADILESLRMPWPTDWTELFGRPGSVIVEVGFGNGQYLLELAALNLSSNILGLEISSKALNRAADKILRGGIENVQLVRARAYSFFWLVCAPRSLAEIHINFPDPWPKRSHGNRRLVGTGFAALAASRLKPGGLIRVASDDGGYLLSVKQVLGRSTYFEEGSSEARTANEPSSLTKYELKAHDEGRKCFYARFIRNVNTVDESFPPLEETMPHAIISTPLSVEEIGRQFDPATYQADSWTVRFIDFFVSTKREQAVVDTYIAEGGLEQRVLLMIKPKRERQFIISLRETGFPRATPATHVATLRLAEHLAAMHPEGEIVRHNISTV
jgi:tRNA (guanine-N7-)-methyltransferase